MSLIEVLVGVVITAVLGATLIQAMFFGLRTVDNTSAKVGGANDSQLIASYFTSDVASAESVSTTGSTLHTAPSVNSSTAGSRLIAFWALQRGTSVTPPEGDLEAWDVAPANLTAAMADETLPGTGPTRDRVATSQTGTSSIGHTITLAKAVFATIARTGTFSKGVLAGSALPLEKPGGSGSNDVYVAQVVVSGGSLVSVTAPGPEWTLVDSRDAGTNLKSLVYVSTSPPSNWTWTWNGSREAAGGVASYSGVAGGGATAHANEVSPCGGQTPTLLLRWTDRVTKVQTVVSYLSRVKEGERQLTRQRCVGTSGTPVAVQTLARQLGEAPPVSTCSKPECKPLPVSVTLSVNEQPMPGYTVGRSYQLRAATRTTE